MTTLLIIFCLGLFIVIFLKKMRELVMNDPALAKSYLENIEKSTPKQSQCRVHLLTKKKEITGKN